MENSGLPIIRNLENVFLIDWLTVTFHCVKVWDVQQILGMKDVPWIVNHSFVNGYPLDLNFGHIHIRYGADDPAYYSDPKKARTDMGICLDISGQGCREFESWSNKSWLELITDIFRCGGVQGARMSVTRLDLAYDDHSGLLNIWQMKCDVEDRNYISKSKKSRIIWSDDQETDIHGLTLEIGSKSSPVLIRIYDKAAERGFKDRHWIRVEVQLRQKRAHEALKLLYQNESIGMVASGIVRNYCMFVTPSSSDSNKARWEIAEYWQRVLEGFEKIRLWRAPGEEYNFSKTENHLIEQYGQILQVVALLHGGSLDSLFLRSCEVHQRLKPKYKRVIEQEQMRRRLTREEIDRQMREWGFSSPDDFGYIVQTNFAELLAPDSDFPWEVNNA